MSFTKEHRREIASAWISPIIGIIYLILFMNFGWVDSQYADVLIGSVLISIAIGLTSFYISYWMTK